MAQLWPNEGNGLHFISFWVTLGLESIKFKIFLGGIITPPLPRSNNNYNKLQFEHNLFPDPKGPPRFFARKKDLGQGARIFTTKFSSFYTYKSQI